MRRLVHTLSFAAAAAAFVAIFPSTAHAFTYTNCFFADVQTNDSGGSSWRGFSEDHWTTCNSLHSCNARLRRARVLVDRPGSESTLTRYTDENTGCITWSSAQSSNIFSFTVETVSSNILGKTDILVHDDPNYTGTNPDTYTTTFANVHPNTPNFYVGNHGGTWTTFAALGFAAWRYPGMPGGIKLYAGIDQTSNCASSAHYGGGGCDAAGSGVCNSNASIKSGRHYIRLAHNEGSCSLAHTNAKFIIGHEAGHALAGLFYGDHPNASNGGEPNVDMSNSSTPNACGTSGGTYSNNSKEYNSVGFREGFAHFVASKIWNNKNVNGAFRLFGTTYDLEWYEFGTNWGGRLENVCCTSGCTQSWDSAGTNQDWMRFFWDWYTSTTGGCSSQPTLTDMMRLYREVRLDGGLFRDNYFDRMDDAVADLGLPGCLAGNSFDTYAAVNGIDNE